MKSTFAGETNLIFSVTNSNYRLSGSDETRSERIYPHFVCPSSSRCKYAYINDGSTKCWYKLSTSYLNKNCKNNTYNLLGDNELTNDYTTLNKDIFLAFVYNDNNGRVQPQVCAIIDNNVKCIYGNWKIESFDAMPDWEYNYDMAKIYNYRSGYDMGYVSDGASINGETIGNYKFSVYTSSGNVTIKNVSGNYGCSIYGDGRAYCGSM